MLPITFINELLETIAGFGKSTATTQNRENLRKIIDQCTTQPDWILALVSIISEGNVDIDKKLQKKIEKMSDRVLQNIYQTIHLWLCERPSI